ncbi:Spy/CpxP family protein refolding chaperone [Variovorax terrae]|uniref:Spy/CpxP family protein refolding chaperone n=1 Tax=Variovorax terrae TaxID=2923278 RepID=A0A9X1VY66_9BURK|nr:Spy/CpxP family protein refolding chaperone [Variovorax terrae]MCJ0765642.1 Spy/CpxP family protein refolding chaperone [Variovorax terrae]
MKQALQRTLVASLLAGVGALAFAQSPAPAGQPGDMGAKPPRQERMNRPDPAKMKEFMAKRQAELKAKLQITPNQEGAWTTFTEAMKPSMHARLDRAEFAKLTTPERIDRMRAMREQRMAAMDKRADAAKAFYATLTPQQQKVFDAETLRRGPHGDGHGPRPQGRPGQPG